MNTTAKALIFAVASVAGAAAVGIGLADHMAQPRTELVTLERVVIEGKQAPATRQVAMRVAGARGKSVIKGSALDVADQMEQWFNEDGCDGFNIMPPFLPGGLDDFVALVIPELQRRGLFRSEYEGRTLRENLGLKRPASRYAGPAPRGKTPALPRVASGG